jgi:hypothetical protein
MSIISQEDAKQAAYIAKLAEAEALPHQPPAYRQLVYVTRNDLQGNPAQTIAGAIVYDASAKTIRLETTDLVGSVTGSISFDPICAGKFSAALVALQAEEEDAEE